MLPPEHLDDDAARRLDDPSSWLDSLTIPDVVGLRSTLVRTMHPVRADRDALRPDRITRLAQELAMAARPVDTEVRLDRAPTFSVAHVGEFTAPHGPTAYVERADLGENPRVEAPVERAVGDKDVLAGDAVAELRRAGVDGYHTERLLSAGLLGQARRRRLVPTRWAITATDDMLAKSILPLVRDLPVLDKPEVRSAERFGNRFHILLLPRVWSFELVEAWLKGSFWSQAGGGAAGVQAASDWEDHDGRTTYAAETTGGYYATRLPVLEHMLERRRQATAVVLREITDAYTTPLGVWVVRETCRRALRRPPRSFDTLDEAVAHMQKQAAWAAWPSAAALLATVRAQRTLDAF